MIVVLADGCFDPFHYGHLAHLQAAARLGDRLVVAVTEDAHVNKRGRPIFPLDERMAVIRELRCVSEVLATPDAPTAIMRVKPEIYVKGKEYEGRLPEQTQVEAYGGRVIFTATKVYSSTQLVSGVYLNLRRLGRR